MTTWTKTPPASPGVYWARNCPGGEVLVRIDGCDGDRWCELFGTECVEAVDYFKEWGPRIPSPETLQRVAEFLRHVC